MMKYLWIILIILAVLSPLMWFKPSRQQLKVTALRKRATELGLRVQLVPAADAREEEKRPEAVRYLLPLAEQGMDWTLVRGDNLNWNAPWPGWRWFGREAPEAVIKQLGAIVPQLSETTNALKMDNQGLSLYWSEQGNIAEVDNILKILKSIKT